MKRLMLSLMLGPIGAWAFVASAQTVEPTAPAPQEESATPSEAARETAGDKDARDVFCLRHTGSRIPMRADRRTGKKDCVAASGRAYTRDDLGRTGEIDLADALRKLDPAIR